MSRISFEERSASRVLDEKDSAIVRALQGDARTTLARLARSVGLAPSSVHERLRSLQRDGVIRGWSVDVDPVAVGRPVTALIGVEADVTGGNLASTFARRQEIDECHDVAGDLSLLLKVRVSDPEALLDLIDWIRDQSGVRATHTTVVLRTYFERKAWLGDPAGSGEFRSR